MSDPLKIHDMILHIDDGSMGGGGPIPHSDMIFYDANEWLGRGPDPKRIDGPNNDFYDYKGTLNDQEYFDWSRKDIFHYTVCVHDYYREDDLAGTKKYPGASSEVPGDDMCITWEGMENDATKQAKRFMHELGRNLGLGTSNTKDTVMYRISAESKVIDFNSNEWNSINLAGIDDTTD